MMEFLATNFNLPTIIVGKNRWARVEHPIGPRLFLE